MKRLSEEEIPNIFDYLEYEFDCDEGGSITKVNKISDNICTFTYSFNKEEVIKQLNKNRETDFDINMKETNFIMDLTFDRDLIEEYIRKYEKKYDADVYYNLECDKDISKISWNDTCIVKVIIDEVAF